MSEREELIRILDTEGAQAGDCGHEPGSIADCPNDCRDVLEGYAEAILAAGYQKVDDESVVVTHSFPGIVIGMGDGMPPIILDGSLSPDYVSFYFDELQRRIAVTKLRYFMEILEGDSDG